MYFLQNIILGAILVLKHQNQKITPKKFENLALSIFNIPKISQDCQCEILYSVTAAAAAAAAAAARLAANSASPPAPSGPPNMMNDQAINDYIRVPDKMVGLSE